MNNLKGKINPSYFSTDALRGEVYEGLVPAWYRFRYIAIPMDLFEMVAKRDLGGYVETNPENHYLNQEEEMKQIFNIILQNKEIFIPHEIEHHNALHDSTFWKYINLCETLRRLLIISMAINGKYSDKSIQLLKKLITDKILIKRCIIPLEEHRLAMVESKSDRLEKEFKEINNNNQIKRCYSSISALNTVLSSETCWIKPAIVISAKRSEYIFPRIIIIMLNRMGIDIIFNIAPAFLRLLKPKIFFNFTLTLISGIFKYNDIVKKPGFRSYHNNCQQVAFDPGSQFGGREVRCDPLEYKIAPNEFKVMEGDLKWINYLVEKRVWLELLGRSVYLENSDYDFISRWLYQTRDQAEEIKSIDRTCKEAIERFSCLQQDSIKWLNECRRWLMVERRSRYNKLSDLQITEYINSYYLHGA